MRGAGSNRRKHRAALPPLAGGSSLPPLEGDGKTDSPNIVPPLAALRAPVELNVSPRWQNSNPNFCSPRERHLEPVARHARGVGALLQGRHLPQLEPLGSELPRLDTQTELPFPVASRSSAQLGSICRGAATRAVGTRLTPLQHESLPGLPLDTTPMPSLRPVCPWERSVATLGEGNLVERGLDAREKENRGTLAPEVFTEADVGRCDVDRRALSLEDEVSGFHLLERNSLASSACESSARAEVERAVHTAFLEECGRGCSPTAAAVEAIRRAASVSRESMQKRGSFFKESHRLLLKEGEDGMGITA